MPIKTIKTDNKETFEPIAIIGVGAVFPGSTNVTGFWRDITSGKDLIKDVPSSHWLIEDYYDANPAAPDKLYCKRGAFLDYIDFDPVEYGIPPNTIPATDTSQLLALIVAKQVLADATHNTYMNIDLSRVSIILGAAALEALQYVAARMQRPVWVKALREAGLPEDAVQTVCDRIAGSYTPWQENTFPGLLGNVIAGRIANRFNLGGTNCITDAACAGSLSALAMAVNELQLHKSDMVVTGGVDTLNDIVMFMCFSKTKALSLNNDCRPFSDKADGTILGEGLGMFALKRLADAEANGDSIYGVIKGVGTSSDGRSKSIYAPLAKGQSEAIRRAYNLAGYEPNTVELIEAHGTGTKAGDMAEFEGLKLGFGTDSTSRKQYCALGSIKSQIGHTKSAAGAAGLLKALLALQHKTLPPTIKVDQPNPQFDIQNSPFYLNTKLRPWIRGSQHPRRAGVSSFGFGGTNFHVTLEEYTGKASKALRLRTVPTELFVFTGSDSQSLLNEAKKAVAYFAKLESFAGAARFSQQQMNTKHVTRLAIVAADIDNLKQKLAQAVSMITEAPDQPLFLHQGIYYSEQAQPGKVAFMFPGQGSQYINMGAEVAMAFDQAMAKWEQAADLVKSHGKHLGDIVFPIAVFTEEERLQQQQQLRATQWAQPALAVTSLALLELLRSVKINPDFAVGHSFGELTALHAAGVIDEATLLKAAQKRGELMQNAAENIPGAMLSVAYPVQELLELLKKNDIKATPANFNSPNQLVLSGTVAAIDQAAQFLQKQGVQYQRLPVSTGFHSHLIEPCCKPFKEFLKDLTFETPQIPVYANITAKPYPNKSNQMKDYLVEQLIKPVKFHEQIEALYQNGVRTFIEVGSHTVLTGIVTQCLDKREFQAVSLDRRGEHGLTALWHGLAKLIVAGLNPELEALWTQYPQADLTEKTSNKFTLKINGTNYGKPYPPMNGSESLPKPNIVKSNGEFTQVNLQTQHPKEASQPVQPQINPNQSKNSATLRTENSVLISNNTNHLNANQGDNMTQTTNLYLIQMYQDLQRQLVDSHNTFQKAMADSHMVFLNSLTQLAGQAAGAPAPMMAAPALNSQSVSMPISMPVMPMYSAPQAASTNSSLNGHMPPPSAAITSTIQQQAPAPTMMPEIKANSLNGGAYQSPVMQQQQPAPAMVISPTPAAPKLHTAESMNGNGHAAQIQQVTTSVVTTQTATTMKADSAFELEKLLMEIVVEKTGYPAEMLHMDMAIEADLGIDSIKRVEILSNISERIPNLPEISPAKLSELQTLGDIVTYMKQNITQNN